MNNIKSRLERWGSWARCSIGTEYPKVNIAFKHILPSSKFSAYTVHISDEEGMLIDMAVSQLKKFDILAYKIVIAHHVYGISQNRLAKEIGKAQSYVANLLRVAEAFIAGQLQICLLKETEAYTAVRVERER